MKRELAELKANDKRLMAAVVNLQDRLESIESKMPTKDHFGLIMARMDGFVRLLEDSRFSWAVHEDKLLDHDRRLKRLEGHG